MSNPFANPQLWDIIQFGQTLFPGIVQSVSINNDFEFEIPQSRDKSKGKAEARGVTPREIIVEVLLWNEDNMDKLNDIMTKEWKSILDGSSQNPFKVFHPQITQAGVDTVFIKNIDLGYPNLLTGQLVTLTLVENTKEKDLKIKSTKKGTSPKPQNPEFNFGNEPTV